MELNAEVKQSQIDNSNEQKILPPPVKEATTDTPTSEDQKQKNKKKSKNNKSKSKHEDKQKKHKKKKHRKHKERSRSRSKSQRRSKSRSHRKSKKSHKRRKQSWSSSRSRSSNSRAESKPKKLKSPLEVRDKKSKSKQREKSVERKQRSKSKSIDETRRKQVDDRKKEINKRIFLRHYNQQIQGQENNNYINDIEAHNELYWDGFQWVARDLTASTRDMRTIQISGLPLDKMDFNEFQLAQFIVVYMLKHCIAEHNNQFPVRSCKIQKETKTAKIELTSIDEANRLKLVGKIPILDRECRLSKIQETNNNIYNFTSQLENAQRAAMAQAMTLQAMTAIQKDITDQKKGQKDERKRQTDEENKLLQSQAQAQAEADLEKLHQEQ